MSDYEYYACPCGRNHPVGVSCALSKPRPKRLCVVCGARVMNINQKANTCDRVCLAARNAGRTRVEQIEFEVENPDPHERQPECSTCGMFLSQCQCWDPVNGVN